MSLALIPNWRQVLFGSWSARLGFLATLLGIVQFALPSFEGVLGKGSFALATVAVTALIPLVRVIQQQELREEHDTVAEKASP